MVDMCVRGKVDTHVFYESTHTQQDVCHNGRDSSYTAIFFSVPA